MPDGEFYKCGEVIDAQLLHQVAPESHSQAFKSKPYKINAKR